MRLHTDDILQIAFDELSHDYHRYAYTIERCEADWTPSEEMFESDWLEGFNAIVIDDHEQSVNTIIPYTHYQLQIPNDQCRLKMSGNYRLHIIDDESQKELACVEFMVTDQTMSLFMEASTNTDIDHNISHQQLSISLNYNNHIVTNPQEQIRMVVRQNDREDNSRLHVSPSFIQANGLRWQHHQQLIFDAGNEYHKYEVIRNSDNRENDTASEYVWVNYRLKAPELPFGSIIIQGMWTTEAPETYLMSYDEKERLYTASILQKQGYYSYQYLWQDQDGHLQTLPSEGNFYQTENRYQAYIYYKGTGERT